MDVDVSHTDEWVEQGIIDADQARLIRAYESATPRRGGVAREILGYLGATLVLVAGFVIVGDLWEDLAQGARILLSAVAALVLTAAGLALGRYEAGAPSRLGQVSLLLGAAPTGLAIGLLVDGFADEEVAVLTGFLAALAYSLVFYVRSATWAQHIALFASSLGSAIALGVVVTENGTFWVTGLLAIAVGGIWLAGSVTERLPPRLLAEVGAVIALGVGSMIVVGELAPDTGGGQAGMALWILGSVGLVTLGVALDRIVLIVGGVLGLLTYLPWLITELFGEGLGVPLALLVAGAVLIGAAVVLARRAKPT